MKFAKLLFFFAGTILFVLACGLGNDLSSTPSVSAPVETLTVPPFVTPRRAHTSTPTPRFFSPVSQPSPFPDWVTDFSDPILESLAGQQPVFEDAFSPICIDEYKEWKVCSTPEQRILSIPNLVHATARPTIDLQPDLKNGYSLLNKGWFYIVPDSPKNPFYANIDNGTLILNLPEGKEKRDFWVYNPKLNLKNFALSFDFQFEETQPDDKVRFQFSQTADQSVAMDLSKNQTWTMHWGSNADWQSTTGTFNYFAPERITVLIIMQGEACAVYLDDAPLTYLSNSRTGPIAYASPQAVKFHLIAESGHFAAVTIDNVKLWDLDKIARTTKP
jgi:hypothetical protein